MVVSDETTELMFYLKDQMDYFDRLITIFLRVSVWSLLEI